VLNEITDLNAVFLNRWRSLRRRATTTHDDEDNPAYAKASQVHQLGHPFIMMFSRSFRSLKTLRPPP
jgi:hypothetical protein